MIKRTNLLLLLLAVNLGKSSADCSTDNMSGYYNNYYYTSRYTICKNLTNLNEAIKELGNYTFLYIENSNLSTAQFSVLHKKLESLQIFNSTMPQLKENTFHGLTALQDLVLRGTKINLLNENMFTSLNNLQTLNMHDNKLEKLYSGIFDGLRNLKILRLSDNNLSVIENCVFNQLTKLEELYLSNNQLKTVDGLFSSLHSLNLLDLGINYISEIPLLSTNITKLFLDENEIKNLDNIADLNKLTYLDVSYNYLETYDAIGGLHNIQTLYLSSNNIEALNKSIISNLTSLSDLDMSYNSIKNIEIGTFEKNQQLYTLNMSHNFLEKISHGMVSIYTRTLDLWFNKIKIFSENIDRYYFQILLEGNNLKCNDLLEYKTFLRGNSFHTENIKGVNCIGEEDNEDIISNKALKILEKKVKESTLYKFLNSNVSLPSTKVEETVSETDWKNFTKLKEKILKILKDKLEDHTSKTFIVNIILTSIILIVLCLILLFLYFSPIYGRLRNTFEFS